MTLQHSLAVRDAQNDTIETTIGTSPILRIRSGPPPADCAAADTGTVLATLNLPADWLGGSTGGVKSLLGTWQDTDADASGTAGHFRIYNSGDTVCHQQGTVTGIGGGGDMELDNPSISVGQEVNVTSYALTAGNA